MRDFLLKISEICLKDSMIHTGGCGVDGVGGGGVGGGGVNSFSCQTQLLSWVEVELGLWQKLL